MSYLGNLTVHWKTENGTKMRNKSFNQGFVNKSTKRFNYALRNDLDITIWSLFLLKFFRHSYQTSRWWFWPSQFCDVSTRDYSVALKIILWNSTRNDNLNNNNYHFRNASENFPVSNMLCGFWAGFFTLPESTRGKTSYTGDILHARALLDIRAVRVCFFIILKKERLVSYLLDLCLISKFLLNILNQ